MEAKILRTALILILLAFSSTALSAETFMGRNLRITDGRANTAAPAPLVIAMHGFLGTSRSMARKTSFDALARKHGYIVAYPNGTKRRWNDGRSSANPVDDVAYLSALIEKLVGDGRADPARIYLAGHSNGGGMAMRMACDRARLIAGISVVATKLPKAYACADGPAVPAIFFHGTADPISPHGGRADGARLGAALSADETLAVWSGRNRCNRRGNPQTFDRKNDGTSAQLFQYRGCSTRLAYALIEGHGHGWPNTGGGAARTRLQGPASEELDAAVLSWWFFDQS